MRSSNRCMSGKNRDRDVTCGDAENGTQTRREGLLSSSPLPPNSQWNVLTRSGNLPQISGGHREPLHNGLASRARARGPDYAS